MKEFGGWQFPDHERHLQEWLTKVNDRAGGRLRYQGAKQTLAMRWCKGRRTAIDVGAHVGLHSFYLAKNFAAVEAFEPVADHRECFAVNVKDANVTLHECALGEKQAKVAIHTTNGSSGDSWVRGEGTIPMRLLDEYEFQDVDFIKLDCEGGELPALRGGEQTLLRCRPCVMVEQKPGKAQQFGLPETGAVDYLQSLGATLRASKGGDFILSWN